MKNTNIENIKTALKAALGVNIVKATFIKRRNNALVLGTGASTKVFITFYDDYVENALRAIDTYSPTSEGDKNRKRRYWLRSVWWVILSSLSIQDSETGSYIRVSLDKLEVGPTYYLNASNVKDVSCSQGIDPGVDIEKFAEVSPKWESIRSIVKLGVYDNEGEPALEMVSLTLRGPGSDGVHQAVTRARKGRKELTQAEKVKKMEARFKSENRDRLRNINYLTAEVETLKKMMRQNATQRDHWRDEAMGSVDEVRAAKAEYKRMFELCKKRECESIKLKTLLKKSAEQAKISAEQAKQYEEQIGGWKVLYKTVKTTNEKLRKELEMY